MRKIILAFTLAAIAISNISCQITAQQQADISKIEADAVALAKKINNGIIVAGVQIKATLDPVCGQAVPLVNQQIQAIQPLLPAQPGPKTTQALIAVNATLATVSSVCGNYQGIDTTSGVSVLASLFTVGVKAYTDTKSNIVTVKAALAKGT